MEKLLTRVENSFRPVGVRSAQRISVRMAVQVHFARSIHRQYTTAPSFILRQLCTQSSRRRGPTAGSVIPLPNLPELRKSGDDDGDIKRALVRAPDLVLRSHALGTEESARLVLLSGEKGRGKSTSLRAAVSAAREAGAIVLYIPNASAWTQGGGFFASARGEGSPKDDEKPIRWYDRPYQTSAALQVLLDAHAPQLESVPCTDSSDWENAREAAEEGVRLVKNIDDDWRMNPRRAGDAFTAVIESLANHEETRFVVAIDEYETLAGLSILGNERGRYVHSDGVATIGRHFGRRSIEKFAESIRNGVVLLAQSGNANGRRVRASRVLETEDFKITENMRKDPNGIVWLKQLWDSNDAVIHYEDFRVKEMQKLLDLQNMGAIESYQKNRLLALAGGRGDVLRKLRASV